MSTPFEPMTDPLAPVPATPTEAPKRKRRTPAEIAEDKAREAEEKKVAEEAARIAAEEEKKAAEEARAADQDRSRDDLSVAIEEAQEVLAQVPNAKWHVAKRKAVMTDPYRPRHPRELRDSAPVAYRALPLPGNEAAWVRLWKSVKLAQSETAPRQNPDGSTTSVTTHTAPALTKVRFDPERGGWRLHVRPLPGQRLADYQGATDALGLALRLPSITIGKSRKQDIVINLNTHKPSFPKALYPNPREVHRVVDEASAVAAYDDLEIDLGIMSSGQRVTYRPKRIPHMLVAGKTGTGKSVFLRGVIELYRAAGADILVADGKASGDYSKMYRPGVAHNVSMVAGDPASILRTVAYAFDEMQRRKQIIDRLKAAGEVRNPFRPLLFLFDEAADFVKSMGSREQKDVKLFNRKLDSLLSQGRSMRIHLILCAQTLYSESIPNSWQANTDIKIAMGRPDGMTVKKLYEGNAEMIAEAERVRSTIDPGTPGRALYSLFDKEAGKDVVAQLMVPYSYTPAEGLDSADGEKNLAAWKVFRDHVSDRVPKLSARVGIAYDAPLEHEDAGYKSLDDHADWHEYSLSELAQLPLVPLDDAHGPIPELAKYDPTDLSAYAGGVAVINKAHTTTRINPPSGLQPRVR